MPATQSISIENVEIIIARIVERCEVLVRAGRRTEILNERYLHHMFSWEVGQWYAGHNIDPWEHLLIAPECPTSRKFRREGIDVDDNAATMANAIDQGKSGNIDFVLPGTLPICVEWKGPKFFGEQEAVEVFIKLLTEPPESPKLFAGVLTSSTTGQYDHIPTAKRRLSASLKFAMSVLNLDSIADRNLHIYLATIPDSGRQDICWGNVSSGDIELTNHVA
jgi:hypothetical protein